MTSLRPEARPATVTLFARATRAIAASETATRNTSEVAITAVDVDVMLDRSLRPRPRPVTLASTPAIAAPTAKPAVLIAGEANAGFDRWVLEFRQRAMAKGITARTFGMAFSHAAFLPKVIERDRNQSEFTWSVSDYLSRVVSDTRVTNGRDKAAAYRTTLAAIEDRYGVDRNVVAAVWGMESNYGTNRGDTHLISALATLAYEGRRGAFFEEQLIAALQILQTGDTTEDVMTGSWAGAMGHTQFIPTSYQAYAVDFTGDGRRDIWSDDPTDALASTAAYLAKHGWIKGMPWGVEVRLPANFDFRHAKDERMPSDWARMGVVNVSGRAVGDFGSAKLLLPAGAKGIAFLTFKNFDVIKRYNASDAYALGVGHLGDRIGGAAAFAGTWPDGERSLKRDEAKELQHLLTQRGYSTGGVDGRIGSQTKAAIRDYQLAAGVPADGYPSVDLLHRLRR
ncbi:lytic murein transglycosylase [Pseudooceanicola sp. LIPI14-2-Ac024]|uniref:lytic murein transglycosylase n=1 Tax=Pseudooceanicola sp. LIPI14-2-Ac024 TaxID=3344875 RepID=UPI0035D09EC6